MSESGVEGDRSGPEDRSHRLASALALVTAVSLTAGLAYFLFQSGLTVLRVALFGAIAVAGWGGAGAMFTDRPQWTIVSALALFALGIWQAVLWILVLPASVGMAVCFVLATQP